MIGRCSLFLSVFSLSVFDLMHAYFLPQLLIFSFISFPLHDCVSLLLFFLPITCMNESPLRSMNVTSASHMNISGSGWNCRAASMHIGEYDWMRGGSDGRTDENQVCSRSRYYACRENMDGGWMDAMERIGDTILVRSANVDQIPR